MFRTKNLLKIIFSFFCLFIITLTVSGYANAESEKIYLGGFATGLVLHTNTVEVIGVCDIITKDGSESPAKNAGIRSGDVILSINGKKIQSMEDVNNELLSGAKTVEINLKRKDKNFQVKMKPIVELSSGKNKIGLLVKDTINGVGTVTYIDPKNMSFGALGHGIVNNGIECTVNSGELYPCLVYDVKKSIKGYPGELKGIFQNTESIGKIEKSNSCGVFGTLNSNVDLSKLKKVEMGSGADAKIGKAKIYTTIDGDKIGEYDVEIVKVDHNNKDNRNYVIKIADDRLTNATGGIVQGMSGSPILQNGKLIGAITHVFVGDPLRGFGISIENMQNS